MNVFPITDIPEFSKKKRIVVVGVIGKSPYRYPNKATPLVPSAQSAENGIECHWDERRSILYLHAVTYLDTKRLTTLAASLNEEAESEDQEADAANWLVASGELAAESCKAIALLFHLCHIVVLSSPTSVFDLGYLQLFKAIDAYRTEQIGRSTEALLNIKATGAWESHGRCCCPRLLFHFRRAPNPVKKVPAALKRLEHAVEDQLYFILRKARIITNVCAKSLFAIPKNEEFVYISGDEESTSAREVSALVRGLVARCNSIPDTPPPRPTFRQFLQTHIDMAFGEGFDDNVGKYAMSTSFFELPSAPAWRAAAQALSAVYLAPVARAQDEPASLALYDALATDVRFSQARCAKVLPIAQASYAEGLPAHYSSQHHAHKVSLALGVLDSMARGPLARGARARLSAACTAIWRTRSLCEALSLTGHVCIEPEHDSSKEHSSGVRYISACNCGRCKWSREDPYSLRRANCTFYTEAAEECGVCPTLQTIDFPVFQPSTPSYKAAALKEAEEAAERSAPRRSPAGSGVSPASAASAASPDNNWSAPDALSPGSAHDEEDDDKSHDSDRYVVPVRGDAATEKIMSRQPSTTEYLPGMLHLGSPAGLLPAFASWSLVCLGASSLYSHALGLPEHLQPGFLPHTNYLLPWDCAVRLESMSGWRVSGPTRGRGKIAPHHHLTVKIFIGFEYECPRGHRFMMSSPDTVVSGGGGALGREAGAAGARLAGADMPLYAPCVCRAAPAPAPPAASLAQLTRLHVVTPKAPVHVTLDPKVQPTPGGPIFVPQPAGSPPIKLSASAYWVLRLPYMYSDERGCLPRPRPGAPLQPGTIIAPLFGLQD